MACIWNARGISAGGAVVDGAFIDGHGGAAGVVVAVDEVNAVRGLAGRVVLAGHLPQRVRRVDDLQDAVAEALGAEGRPGRLRGGAELAVLQGAAHSRRQLSLHHPW